MAHRNSSCVRFVHAQCSRLTRLDERTMLFDCLRGKQRHLRAGFLWSCPRFSLTGVDFGGMFHAVLSKQAKPEGLSCVRARLAVADELAGMPEVQYQWRGPHCMSGEQAFQLRGPSNLAGSLSKLVARQRLRKRPRAAAACQIPAESASESGSALAREMSSSCRTSAIPRVATPQRPKVRLVLDAQFPAVPLVPGIVSGKRPSLAACQRVSCWGSLRMPRSECVRSTGNGRRE